MITPIKVRGYCFNNTTKNLEEYKDFYLSQTAVKDLEKDTTCPDRWRAQWLTKELHFPSNEDMDKGKYFEWRAIGAGAISGEDVTDLPRTGAGKKTADHIRIDEQVERFKNLFDPNHPEFQGFEIINTQVEMKVGNRKGTIDFVTTHLETKETWINDLKLTRDATSTRSEYGWGHDWKDLDLMQMVHYRDLYSETFKIVPRVALWVFDYSPMKIIKIGELLISQKAVDKKNLRFESAAEVIELYNKNGWVKLPSEKECKDCKLNCEFRKKPDPIEKLIVSI